MKDYYTLENSLPAFKEALRDAKDLAGADVNMPYAPRFEPAQGRCALCGMKYTMETPEGSVLGDRAAGKSCHASCLKAELSKDWDGSRHLFYANRGLELSREDLAEALYPMALAMAAMERSSPATAMKADGTPRMCLRVLEVELDD
jgi:hypothetical protein